MFRFYLKWLFRRRFRGVYVKNEYPNPGHSSIYYLNHHYWWDGLTPLLLSEFVFRQKARAIMDEKQLLKYPFFQKIGVFSVNLDDPRKAIASLRYALESLKRPNSCLFIYPQGKFYPLTEPATGFKGGLNWLAKNASDSDVVPIAQWIDFRNGDKPELWIHIGKPIPPEAVENLRNDEFATILQKMLDPLISFSETDFKDWDALIGKLPGNRK